MRRHCIAFTAALALAACGGGGEPDSPAPPGVPTPYRFAEVDRAAGAAFSSQSLSGMGLAIYDAQGVKRFEKMYGDFAPDRRIAARIACSWAGPRLHAMSPCATSRKGWSPT